MAELEKDGSKSRRTNRTISCDNSPVRAPQNRASSTGSMGPSIVRGSRKATGRPPLNVALVDVRQEHRQVLRQSCLAAGYSPVFKTVRDPSLDRVGHWADLIVVESDLGCRALHSADRVRRAGGPPVGMLVNWWSDLEQDARQAADFVLHVPLTVDEVRDLLALTVPRRTEGRSSPICTRRERRRAGED